MAYRTDTKLRPRVEAGVREGGEFTNRHRSEPGEVSFDRFDGLSIGADVLTKRKGTDRISAADALIVAQYHARLVTHAGNYQDVEDIAQDAIVAVLENNKKPAITPGLISRTARTARAKQTYALAGLRHEDVKGRDDLNDVVAAIETLEAREVSPRERAEMAELTRETWEQPRHKPRIGFEKHFRNVALEENFDAVAGIAAEPIITADSQRSTGHDLADQVEAGTLSREGAYLRVWDAFAEEYNLPTARANSLSEARAAAYEALVLDPVGTAKAVAAGIARPLAVTAFLAPFGDLTPTGRARLVDAIASRPDHGRMLWTAALHSARGLAPNLGRGPKPQPRPATAR